MSLSPSKISVKSGDYWALYLLRLSSVVSVIFTGCILLMGFVSLIAGVCKFVGIKPITVSPFVKMDSPDFYAALATLTNSLEFFLLAPLAYLLLRTLGNYLGDLLESPTGQPKEGTSEALISVKALSTGLLIAMLATNLVGDFLTGKNLSAETFPWIKTLSGCALLLVLTLYFSVLHKDHADHSSGNS